MNEGELQQCYTALGVAPGVSLEELERTYMKRNFALLKGKSGAVDQANPELDMQRQHLRSAHERLAEHLRDRDGAAATSPRNERGEVAPPPRDPTEPAPTERLLTPPVLTPRDPADDEFFLFRFDHWKVNTFVPPLLLGLVWLVNLSPLKSLLTGFHVWMHEFGHATAAWLCGFRATPLPFGWTRWSRNTRTSSMGDCCSATGAGRRSASCGRSSPCG